MTRVRRFGGSLLTRLAAGYVLVAVVFAAAWVWSLYGPLTDAVLRQQQANLTAVAQSAVLVASQPDAVAAVIAKQLVARTDLRLTIVGSDGAVLADSDIDPAAMENHADRPEIAAALQGRTGTARRSSATEGTEQLYVAVPGSIDGQRVAIRVSQPLAEIERIAGDSRRVGLLLLALALAIAGYIAYRTTRAAARPIAELTQAAGRMAAGDLRTEIPAVPADLEALAHSLAELRDEIEARIDALEAEKRTLSSTLDGLPDIVLVFEHGAVRLANRAALAVAKVPTGQVRGSALESLGLPAPAEQAVASGLARAASTTVELDADPTGRALRVSVLPLEGTGTGRAVVVISDITERVRVEKVRRDFVANASHELKTPVAGIHLLAQSAGNAAGDGDTEMALSFTRQIEDETARLQRLVGDLLDLSRVESTPAPGTIADVREAIDRAIVSHRSAATRAGLELGVDLSKVRGEDLFARIDTTDLAIALDNLLDNAIAYTDHGSVNVRVSGTGLLLKISVTDTGPGIAPEHLDRIFERFYRVDRGRSRDAGGTGLGLALVKHVAERAGGSVSVTSQPGQGTTFALRLPRAR